MMRISVSSSDLKSVGYENGILEIEFHSGGIYQYQASLSCYQALMSASSHGKYFAQHIKHLPFRKIR